MTEIIDRICGSNLPARERWTLIGLLVALRWEMAGRVTLADICKASALGRRATIEGLYTLRVAGIVDRVERPGESADYVVSLDALRDPCTTRTTPCAPRTTPCVARTGDSDSQCATRTTPCAESTTPCATRTGPPEAFEPNAREGAHAAARGDSFLDLDLEQEQQQPRARTRDEQAAAVRIEAPSLPAASPDDFQTDTADPIAPYVAAWTEGFGEPPTPEQVAAIRRWRRDRRPAKLVCYAAGKAREARRIDPIDALRYANGVVRSALPREYDPKSMPPSSPQSCGEPMILPTDVEPPRPRPVVLPDLSGPRATSAGVAQLCALGDALARRRWDPDAVKTGWGHDA